MSPRFDPATDPALKGILAPVTRELPATPMKLVAGAIPRELRGTYYRNGPNPRYTPIGSYTYPLDGDGMVHAVRFADGRATYGNRFVRTPALVAEERAGRALWGGLLSGIVPGVEEVGAALAGRPKELPDVNVIRHAGRLLALAEGDCPYQLDADLATLGRYTFGDALPFGICAHPKLDPATGELVVFRYGFTPPLLSWATIGADGRVTRAEQPIEIDATYMIHDFAITPSYVALFVCPSRFDLSGGPPLRWQPERGTRIAVISRDGSRAVQWIDHDAFWVWHFANAFEKRDGNGGTTIVVDFAWWSALGLGGGTNITGEMRRASLDLRAGRVRFDTIDERIAEFPRIDDRRTGREHRYIYAAGKDGDNGVGEWNLLRRYDVATGEVLTRRDGNAKFGEPLFAAAPGGAGETDGYVLTYAFRGDTTQLLVLNAADFSGEPAAVLELPQRVPMGLHGNFVAD
jgi:carotenoid cleavage dioxygenase